MRGGLWLLFVLLVIILAFVGYKYYQRSHPVKSSKPPVMTVSLTPVKLHNVPLQVKALGTIIAPQTIMVQAMTDGKVVGIYFNSGERVKRGQLLVQLDDTQQKANVDRYRSIVATDFGTYQRNLTLLKNYPHSISIDDLSKVKNQLDQDRAQLAGFENQLANTQVKASFSGIVGALQPLVSSVVLGGQSLSQTTQLYIGAYLKTGDNITVLSNPDSVLVRYQVPQDYSANLALKQQVEISTAAYPGKIFNGAVSYISPYVMESTQAYNVEAMVNVAKHQLRSGMSAVVTQTLLPKRKVLAVPGIALVPDLMGFSVYGLDHGKVKSIPVTLGSRFNAWVEIKSGLHVGDKIIVSKVNQVQPGSLAKAAVP